MHFEFDRWNLSSSSDWPSCWTWARPPSRRRTPRRPCWAFWTARVATTARRPQQQQQQQQLQRRRSAIQWQCRQRATSRPASASPTAYAARERPVFATSSPRRPTKTKTTTRNAPPLPHHTRSTNNNSSSSSSNSSKHNSIMQLWCRQRVRRWATRAFTGSVCSSSSTAGCRHRGRRRMASSRARWARSPTTSRWPSDSGRAWASRVATTTTHSRAVAMQSSRRRHCRCRRRSCARACASGRRRWCASSWSVRSSRSTGSCWARAARTSPYGARACSRSRLARATRSPARRYSRPTITSSSTTSSPTRCSRANCSLCSSPPSSCSSCSALRSSTKSWPTDEADSRREPMLATPMPTTINSTTSQKCSPSRRISIDRSAGVATTSLSTICKRWVLSFKNQN